MKLYPDPEDEMPECSCFRCYVEAGYLMRLRMFLCPTCGNKRCPHAEDHREECSGSNEVDQPCKGNDQWYQKALDKYMVLCSQEIE